MRLHSEVNNVRNNPDEIPSVSQSEMSSQKMMPRRKFLQWIAIAGGTLLSACMSPDTILKPAPKKDKSQTPTQKPQPAATETTIPPTPETITPHEEQVIVDYQRKTQQIYTQKDSDGNERVVRCDVPTTAENAGGFVYNKQDYLWDKKSLPEIQVGGKQLPLITVQRDINPEQMSFLEAWYKDPQHVEKELKKMKLPPFPGTMASLVVHYKSTRNDFWQENPQGKCEKTFYNDPAYNPQDLQNELLRALSENTDGLINYQQTGFEVIDEKTMPLTEDPHLSLADLISTYHRSINYQQLAELAVKRGVATVFVWTGASAGMYESTVWTEKNTGTPIQFFGLNYDLPADQALESWGHFLENQVLASVMSDIYTKCVGRDAEYSSLPYSSSKEADNKNVSILNDGTVYAAMGLGTVHLTPNSISQYQFNSPIPVMLPGHNEPIDMNLWGGTQMGYYSWWLKSLPRDFFRAIR